MEATGSTDKRMTIVVPVYNRERLMLRCLDSLYAQKWRPLHVIAVDNASTDNTLANIREWAKEHSSADFKVSVYNESRKGAAYARQTGLDHTVTERVMFFDSDDTMRPECVSEVMEAWSKCPEAEIVAWPVTIHYPDHPADTHSISGNLPERHLVHSILRTHGYAVKTEFMRNCGGWKGEYPVWDDFETGIRLLLRDPVIVAIGNSLVDIYPQNESITGTDFSSKAGKWEKTLDGIEKEITESGRWDKDRLVAIVNYRRAILAADYAKEGRRDLADTLYRRALSGVSRRRRPLMRLAYHWTKCGLRGAFAIIGRLL